MRRPLCSYYSPDKEVLLQEIRAAYLACWVQQPFQSGEQQQLMIDQHQLLALVVPHGAACDGFVVAAAANTQLNAFLKHRRCRHLTAVLLGTEHRGTTPVALSRQDWATPLGTAPVDTSAVDFLAQQLTSSSSSHTAAAALINETPHSTEHSIENQLPFLVHGAAHGWDLAAAGCSQHNATTTSPEEAPAACSESTQQQHQQHQHQQQQDNEVSPAAATLSIVPISIGYLGNNQPHTMIQSIGAAVRALLLRLQQHADHQQHDNGQAVVLIVTSDFTHAGPWYRELPPAGVSLEDYMTAQDTPVLQAVQQGSVNALLSAAASTRNSMCGLYPLAVALEVLYGSGSSDDSSSGVWAAAKKPVLLDYRAAHTIFARPDSTGFAAFAVYAKDAGQH